MDNFLYITSFLILCVLVYEVIRILHYSRLAVRSGKKTTPFSHIVTNPRKRILIIGDSTSYGTGASDSRFSLAGRLAEAYPDITIINESKNALDLRELTQKLKKIEETYDVLMIHIGGIDTLKFTPEWKMKKYFREINTELNRLHIPVRVLITVNNVGLAPFMKYFSAFLYCTRSKKMHTFFEKISKMYGMHHVSLYELPGNDPLAHDTARLFSEDKIHPSNEGYGIWFEKINATLKPLIT